jgi:hypothetical protein
VLFLQNFLMVNTDSIFTRLVTYGERAVRVHVIIFMWVSRSITGVHRAQPLRGTQGIWEIYRRMVARLKAVITWLEFRFLIYLVGLLLSTVTPTITVAGVTMILIRRVILVLELVAP